VWERCSWIQPCGSQMKGPEKSNTLSLTWRRIDAKERTYGFIVRGSIWSTLFVKTIGLYDETWLPRSV